MSGTLIEAREIKCGDLIEFGLEPECVRVSVRLACCMEPEVKLVGLRDGKCVQMCVPAGKTVQRIQETPRTEHAEALNRVLCRAVELFHGNGEAARIWFEQKVEVLQGRAPADMFADALDALFLENKYLPNLVVLTFNSPRRGDLIVYDLRGSVVRALVGMLQSSPEQLLGAALDWLLKEMHLCHISTVSDHYHVFLRRNSSA